jgi:hypothetical protein
MIDFIIQNEKAISIGIVLFIFLHLFIYTTYKRHRIKQLPTTSEGKE